MVAAMATFVVNDALVKLAAAHFPTGQLLALRGVVSVASALALVAALGHQRSCRWCSRARCCCAAARRR